MIKHPFSGLRLAVATAAVIGLVVISAAPVAADTTPPGSGYFTQNGSNASVDASSCTSNGDGTETCVYQSIGIFSGKMTDSLTGVTHSNQVCVSIYSFTYSDVTGEYVDDLFESGCRADLPSGTVRVDSKLNSASLATTTLAIQAYACDKIECVPGPTRDVTVAGTWTGFGIVTTSKYRSSFDDGFCRSNEAFKGSGRSATFAGTLDGQALSGDVFAGLSAGRSSFRSRCVEV